MSVSEHAYQIKSERFSDDSPKPSFFWKPHSFTILMGIIAFISYFALTNDSTDVTSNSKKGLVIGMLVFLAVAGQQFKDGPFMRPHPVVWRLVLGVSILYEMGILFLLFQTPQDGRQMLKFLDPELGIELPEETYAEDCRFYVPDSPNPFSNFLSKLDRFVVAHLLGWVVKALAYRNTKILLVCSLCFELLEYTLEFQLPNFGECWWDHWILDFVICNGGGIVIGLWLCNKLEMRNYHWRGIRSTRGTKNKLVRAINQFTPYWFSKFEWRTSSLYEWCGTVYVILVMMFADVNAFYLKTTLWIPAKHPFNIYRLLMAGMAAPVAVAETHAYVTDPKCRKLGMQTTFITLLLVTEVLLYVKYGSDLPPLSDMDLVWQYFWIATVVVVVLTTIYFAVLELKKSCTTIEPIPEENEEEVEAEKKIAELQAKKQN
eukprot:m.212826 g.212826  ORF g.212826 m.212826 type:complete len:431 (-) comp15075_c2_seq21:5356-6648(-)